MEFHLKIYVFVERCLFLNQQLFKIQVLNILLENIFNKQTRYLSTIK